MKLFFFFLLGFVFLLYLFFCENFTLVSSVLSSFSSFFHVVFPQLKVYFGRFVEWNGLG